VDRRGRAEEFKRTQLREANLGERLVAVSFKDAADSTDKLVQVYEMAAHWADVLIVATPIRWGAASSLYYKMVERMNCIQSPITLSNKVLIQNKVAAF
jgi:multimeric flavodoxin WrbA